MLLAGSRRDEAEVGDIWEISNRRNMWPMLLALSMGLHTEQKDSGSLRSPPHWKPVSSKETPTCRGKCWILMIAGLIGKAISPQTILNLSFGKLLTRESSQLTWISDLQNSEVNCAIIKSRTLLLYGSPVLHSNMPSRLDKKINDIHLFSIPFHYVACLFTQVIKYILFGEMWSFGSFSFHV